jgi:peptide/nickel transport system substrate-binding protein
MRMSAHAVAFARRVIAMVRRIRCSRTTIAWCFAVLVLLGLSCGGGERARRGGTLVVGEISDYESLNPLGTTDAHARDAYNLLFLLLLDEHPDFLTFGPRLAESYEFSPDRLTLTFHLRRNVVWSDGMPVTARDVAATFRAQKDPAVMWTSRHLKDKIDSVSVIDDWTVAYHFNAVYPYQLMDANDGVILPAHVLEKMKPEDIRNVPIEQFPTDGPFKLGRWDRGQSLELVRNESYYEKGKPYIEKVVFKIIPDQVALLAQLKSGEIDCMEMVPYGEVTDLRANHPELQIFEFQTIAYNYIAWNAARPPFDNVRVRRALTMAIDRKRIIDNIYYGYADECTSPLVPLFWAHNPGIEPVPYDTATARTILANEGFKDTDGDGWLERGGKRFEFEMITNYGNQRRVDTEVMVQDMLRAVGVKVNPVSLEWTTFLERVKSSDFEAVVNGWRVGTKVDLSPIWSCEARKPGGFNRVGYCNPAVDSLNAAATGMIDFERARPLFYRAQELIYNDQPFTFLNVPRAVNVVDRRFRDVKPDAISMYHYLYNWWISGNETRRPRSRS